jgi:hypothetical protein
VELILSFVGRLLVEGILQGTGRVLVFLLSFGRWRSESIEENEGRIHGPAGAISFKRDGQRVITTDGNSFIGLVFYLGLIALFIAT